MIDQAVRCLLKTYRALPYKPLKKSLIRLFRSYKQIRKNRELISTVNGIRYQLDLKEAIDSSIYYEGDFEHHTIPTIHKFIHADMSVVDVGANIGYYTLNFAKLVGPGGSVFAFEPTNWAYNRLIRNITLNDFENIVVEKVALSNNISFLHTKDHSLSFQASFTLEGGLSNKINEDEIITCTTLDEYWKNYTFLSLDFLKVDVDGFEFRVIDGSKKLLQKHRPFILIEIGRQTMESVGDSPEDLLILLKDLGYDFFSEDSSQNLNTNEILKRVNQENTNVLCRHVNSL